VTEALPGSGHDYALALVQTLAFLSPVRTALPAAASGVGAVPQIKRRLTMIVRGYPSLSRLGGAAVVAMGLALLPWAPSFAQQSKEPPASPPQLRQQQIEALRQLLKTLERQEKAEAQQHVRSLEEAVLQGLEQQHKAGQQGRPPDQDFLRAAQERLLVEAQQQAQATRE